MKTFKELTIGDKIHILDSNQKLYEQRDKYGNLYNSGKVNRDETITILKMGEDNSILINEYKSYHGDGWRFHIPSSDKEKCMLVRKDDVIFSDKDVAEAYIKQHVLNAIAYEEEIAKKAVQTAKTHIEEIRKSYWLVLNPSSKK